MTATAKKRSLIAIVATLVIVAVVVTFGAAPGRAFIAMPTAATMTTVAMAARIERFFAVAVIGQSPKRSARS